MAPPASAVGAGALQSSKSQPRGLQLASNLPSLQNLIKRDPKSYSHDFLTQWNHYLALRSLLMLDVGGGGGGGGGSGGVGGTPGVDQAQHLDAMAAAGGAEALVHGGRASRLSKEQMERFGQLLSFVTQLSPCYPDTTAALPSQVSQLLLHHHDALTPDLRRSCVRSLVLLRNRNVVSSEDLCRTLFPLLTIATSTSLRSLVHSQILVDLKTANAKARNHRLNRVVQGMLFGIVERDMPARNANGGGGVTGTAATTAAAQRARSGFELRKGVMREAKARSEALWAVRLAAELWRKGIWVDSKTVSLLALACFHPHPKVQSSAIRFFLGDLHTAELGDGGGGAGGASESDSGAEAVPDLESLKHRRKVKKKTRSAEAKMRRAAAAVRKARRREQQEARERLLSHHVVDGAAAGASGAPAASSSSSSSAAAAGNTAALHLLNDAQGFGERLYEELSLGDRRLVIEVKVRMMQLLSRVMSFHKCTVLGFYSYIMRYLQPHQRFITLILVSLAQSVHALTPPDVLLPLVRRLADGFVHPGASNEVVAAGLNTVREICTRQPFALDVDEEEEEEEEEGNGGEEAEEGKGGEGDGGRGGGGSREATTKEKADGTTTLADGAVQDDGKAVEARATVSSKRAKPGVGNGARELLSDLVLYRKSKDKGVSAAARGILALYRAANPAMLARRERGREGAARLASGERPRTFGAAAADDGGATVHGIQGIELLERHLEEQRASRGGGGGGGGVAAGGGGAGDAEVAGEEEEEEEEHGQGGSEGWDGWEVESTDSDDSYDSGGWINVSSDEEGGDGGGIDISDSDEDAADESRGGAGGRGGKEGKARESKEEEKAKLKGMTPEQRRAWSREVRRRWREKARRRREGLSSGEEEQDDDDDESEGEAIEDGTSKNKAQPSASGSTAVQEAERISTLATTKILTPADFAKLNELRAQAAAEARGGKGAKRTSTTTSKTTTTDGADETAAADGGSTKATQRKRKPPTIASATAAGGGGGGGSKAVLDEADILGASTLRKRQRKADYEERMASIERGREGREKFGSQKGKRKAARHASSTNEEKAKKNKNFQMVAKSFSVRSKKGASLRDKAKKLKAHRAKQRSQKMSH